MNSNSYPNPSSSGSNPSANNTGYQPAINPALLASFQGSNTNQTQNSNQKSAGGGGGVNPTMLMGINPAQMLQQMNGGGNNSGMGMNFNGGMGAMGVARGQPQQHASQSSSHLQSQQMHPNMSQNSPSNPQGSSLHSHQQQMNQLNPPAMLSAMGMTREQFGSLNHAERQAKMMLAAQMMGMGGMGNMSGGMGNMNGNMGNAGGGMGNMGGSMGATGGMNMQGIPNAGGMRGAGMQNMHGMGNIAGVNMPGLGGGNNNGMGNVIGNMGGGMGGGMNNGMSGGMNNMAGMGMQGMSNNISAMGMSMLGSLMNTSPTASNGGNPTNPQFNPSQNPQFYDRPPSAMGGGRHSSQQPQDRHQPGQAGAQISSQPQQMMPPPPIRPQSRSLSSSSNPGGSTTPGIMPRPPSRDQAMMMMNGYNTGKPPQTPQQSHQQLQSQSQSSQGGPGQNPYPQPSTPGLPDQSAAGLGQSSQPQNHGSPPMPGSPYRGAKRKVGGDGSPRAGSVGLPGVGANMPGGMMGPPMNLPNTNGGYMQRPRSSMDQQSLGLGQPGINQHPSGGERERQRQGSNPPSGTVIRQGSVPPPISTKEGMRSSLPPAPPQPAAPSTFISTTTPRANTPGPLPVAAPPPSVIPSIPPLPAGVSLNPLVTRVSIVPLHSSTTTIPALDATEIQDIQNWMHTDKEYDAEFRKMKERMAEEARGVFGPAAAMWWEKGWVGVGGGLGALAKGRERRPGFDIRYPRRDRRERERGREGRKRREGLRLPRKLLEADTEKPELLVPIRLEFDVEHHKMRDTFVWNLNDPVVTPENFAQSVVEDYNLPSSYHTVIVKSIQDQLSDYKAHTAGYDGDGGEITIIEDELDNQTIVGVGLLQDEDSTWWHGWRKNVSREIEASTKRRRTRKVSAKGKAAEGTTGRANLGEDAETKPDNRPMALDGPELDEKSIHEDMRILIKLDIIVGSMKLDDQFEWDLDNTNASPEEFAAVYAKELGLGGEFCTAIAHAIREQVQIYQKSLFLVGHPLDGSAIQDEELRSSFLPSLTSGARPLDQVQSFTPLLNYLSDGEIERTEKDRDKDMNRRRKRNTRGRRGIALPDREPIRTLDPATLALAAAANAPTSRRAAAAAASLNIANMVASENGTAFLAPMPAAPQPIIPTVAKEKRTKGLFKAPTYPPTVLRPRANVAAPTPHTAADVSKLPAPLENDPPPSTSVAPIDPKIMKAMTAKRAKELEREAKEKEFADGKYWHRHRRPKPVEYNRNPEFHKRESELTKVSPTTSKKKGAQRGQNSTRPTTPAEEPSEPQSPPRSTGGLDTTSRQSPPPILLPMDDERAMSPVSSASSASEAPLAQRVRMNGNHAVSAPPASSRPSTPTSSTQAEIQSASAPPLGTTPGSEPPPSSASPSRPSRPPQWLSEAMHAMQTTYPHDKFEIILRKVNPSTPPEWRIKCSDCPGKLYTPGPGETLSNYEVHLRNRLHRQRVNDRLNGTNSS
ncbi:hypothetical protein BD779DRAFT_1467981 [Infundibulicybe gibba]|nr:hypothetical protein BD779DRAFT_1467981 [Infundibulicybe gibba]